MTVTHRTVRGVAVELEWAAVGRQARVVSVDGGQPLGTVAETVGGWVATRPSGLAIDHAYSNERLAIEALINRV